MKPTFALIGLPTDRHSSYLRGPAKGPAFVRAALACDGTTIASEDGHELGRDLIINDCGDAPLREADGDDDIIERSILAPLRAGHCPISIGGDHSVTYPVLRAVRAHAPKLTIIHVDAHPDLYDEFEGDRFSHACPFARIMEEGLADRLVQVGIRAATGHQRAQARRFGVEVIDMRHVRDDLRIALDTPVYISVDLDVLDPAFVPGVSHREPGGMSVRQLLSLLQSLEAPVVAADVVELNPRNDQTGGSAIVAGKVLRELLGVMLGRDALA